MPADAPPGPPTSGTFVSVGVKLPLATVIVVAAVAALTYVTLTRFERENLLRAKETAAEMMVECLRRGGERPRRVRGPDGDPAPFDCATIDRAAERFPDECGEAADGGADGAGAPGLDAGDDASGDDGG